MRSPIFLAAQRTIIVVVLFLVLISTQKVQSRTPEQQSDGGVIALYNRNTEQQVVSARLVEEHQVENGFLHKPYDLSFDTNDENAPVAPHYRRFNINTFFDHNQPNYRDDGQITIFTDKERTETNNDRQDQGRNWYGGHPGLDIDTGDNELNVWAAANGKVDLIGVHDTSSFCSSVVPYQTDQVVMIGHDVDGDLNSDYWTEYRHLASFGARLRDSEGNPQTQGNWNQDDIIFRGETLGVAGNRGCSTGAHLHFEVKRAQAENSSAPQTSLTYEPVDPFGWWSNEDDPWADAESNWIWASGPSLPADVPGSAAITDDGDHSFQKFMPLMRVNSWKHIPQNNAVNDSFWLSTAIGADSDATPTNWAVWGLHVPERRQYHIEAFIPALPIGNTNSKVTAAEYNVRYRDAQGQLQQFTTSVDQRVSDQWVRLTTSAIELQPGPTTLVILSDTVPNEADHVVVFDAIRLVVEDDSPLPLPPGNLGNLAIVLDDTTSMNELGKIGSIKTELDALMDQLVAADQYFNFTLVPFANEIVYEKLVQTSNPNVVRQWIASLDPDQDEGNNEDCAENSLEAVQNASSRSTGGPLWLVTDDIPLNATTMMPRVLVDLLLHRHKLNVIVYPPTCTSSGDAQPYFLAYQLASRLTGGSYFRIETSDTEEAIRVLLAESRASAQLAWVGSSSNGSTSSVNVNAATNITYEIPIDGSISRVGYLLNELSGDIQLQVIDPNGNPIDDQYPGLDFVTFASNEYLNISAPVSGTWHLAITGSGEYILSASATSDISFDRLAPSTATVTRPFVLTARLSGPVSTATFELVSNDGLEAIAVAMNDDGSGVDFVAGDGIFTGQTTLTQFQDYRLRVTGQTDDGQIFVRTDSWPIHAQSLYVESPDNRFMNSGDGVEYPFLVGNTGQNDIQVNLLAESSAGWPVSVLPTTVLVPAGQGITVTVTLQIPEDQPGGALDEVTLTVVQTETQAGLPQGIVWGKVRTWLSSSDVAAQDPTALDPNNQPADSFGLEIFLPHVRQ